jgi:hypothetical protein
MAVTATKNQTRLAQIVVALVVAFIAFGAILYGFSAEVRHRVWEDLLARPSGPMKFRFVLQPVMSLIAALRDGIEDARLQRAPFIWALLTRPLERQGRLNEAVISTARVILLGLVMDAIFQMIVFNTFYPAEAVIVALVLAFLPYALLRGPIARVSLWSTRRKKPQ